ncbi:MAG: hypothetical protein EA424_05370 [Planctomycetaceae bacterium]|nr:MAG: hypothetical protein EA424_05370 [Planctomycetaceae bacterium]
MYSSSNLLKTHLRSNVACGSLITEQAWDDYDLEALLPLKEVDRERTDFGFLMRHYWMPVTDLRFRHSFRLLPPDGPVKRLESQIDRRMARCRANECTWRETFTPLNSMRIAEQEDAAVCETLCSCDCYDQTYVSAKPGLFALPSEEQKNDARRRALYCLPFLHPPGPVPVGSSWHGKVDPDYMNFCLEAEEQIGETSVLIIRREGHCVLSVPVGEAGTPEGQKVARVVIKRTGVTVFAWARSVVLEDRFFDRVVEAEDAVKPKVGTASQVIFRLVRSCPIPS